MFVNSLASDAHKLRSLYSLGFLLVDEGHDFFPWHVLYFSVRNTVAHEDLFEVSGMLQFFILIVLSLHTAAEVLVHFLIEKRYLGLEKVLCLFHVREYTLAGLEAFFDLSVLGSDLFVALEVFLENDIVVSASLHCVHKDKLLPLVGSVWNPLLDFFLIKVE